MSAVLSVNAGSSSLKFGAYAREPGPMLLGGAYEGLEPGGEPVFRPLRDPAERLPDGPLPSFDRAWVHLADWLRRADRPLEVQAVSHRIVHGGGQFTQPVLLTEAVLSELDRLSPLAPLHQPHNLAGVKACAQVFPQVPQIGCFDTAFHAGMPQVEQRFALPDLPALRGVRRYGFHGLSYQHVTGVLQRLCAKAQGRVLMAHLGNGASLCATQQGRSVATSMGFSALDGLMMGTRSGSLDAGVVLHLMRQGWGADALEDLLYRRSGLLGVSGVSADWRTLEASTDPRAAQALGLFTHRIVRESGALAAVLGGLDVMAFTGGIGEHQAGLRLAVGRALAHLGVEVDAAANAAVDGTLATCISSADSRVALWVVPTDEGRVAADAAWGWLEAQGSAFRAG